MVVTEGMAYCVYSTSIGPLILYPLPPPSSFPITYHQMLSFPITFQIRSDHLLLLQKCKAVVAEGVCLFVQEPNKYPQVGTLPHMNMLSLPLPLPLLLPLPLPLPLPYMPLFYSSRICPIFPSR